MMRIALRALGLVIVIPALVVIYLFRGELAGKEIPLLLVLALAALGFSLLWGVLKAISRLRRGLETVARGASGSLGVERGPAQFREMAEIIDALNHLTIEFRENAAQLENLITQFSTLAELTEISAKVPDIRELLNLVLIKAMGQTNAKRGTIMLLRESGDAFEIESAEGWTPEGDNVVPLDSTLAAKVVAEGRPLLVENIETIDDAGRPNDGNRFRSPSFLIMPLKTKSGTVGVVCLAEKATGVTFTPQDQQFLTVMLGQIGFAVENARLLKQARESAQHLKATVQHQEIQIERAQKEIIEAQKLSALGQLAGGVAHDFNNLVQAILGYTEMAQMELPPHGRRYRDLEQVRMAAERAANLTRELLAFGRRQVLQTVDLKLMDVVTGIGEMLRPLLGDKIHLEVDSSEPSSTVHADRRQIEQVVMNLCINSRDAMPDGGVITIRTSNVVIDEAYAEGHPSTQPGNYVLLSIADTGQGMDPETLDQAFEPFFTTKEVGRGTGLGLATVYGIIKQHGGMIEVSSEVGRGTTFSIYLPAVDRPASAMEAAAAAVPHGGSETVLVAEDEECVRSLCTRVLQDAGYSVLAASDGREAVRLFELHKDRIHLALVDAVMPGMNGPEVCKLIKSLRPDVAIILSSGYSPSVINTRFVHEEGMELLQKPFRSVDLLAKVRGVLDAARV